MAECGKVDGKKDYFLMVRQGREMTWIRGLIIWNIEEYGHRFRKNEEIGNKCDDEIVDNFVDCCVRVLFGGGKVMWK
ncbi:MAG: hypothetical protein OEL83_02045 [Desulforhopalus sp.]|nr:hypothetical protein [Desulforhopalus sp.]